MYTWKAYFEHLTTMPRVITKKLKNLNARCKRMRAEVNEIMMQDEHQAKLAGEDFDEKNYERE